MYRSERTTSPSLHGVIRGQGCDFSEDREGRANNECFSIIFHLAGDLSIFEGQRKQQDMTDVSISSCPYRSPFYVVFLTLNRL